MRVVVPEDVPLEEVSLEEVPLEEVLPPSASGSPSGGWSAEWRRPIQAQTYVRRS